MNIVEITTSEYTLVQNFTSNWVGSSYSYLDGTLNSNLTTYSTSPTSVIETISLIPSFGPKIDNDNFDVLFDPLNPPVTGISSPCTKQNIEQDYTFVNGTWVTLVQGENTTYSHTVKSDPSLI